MALEVPAQYRRNAAIFVLNASGEILACERTDVAGAWQIPQGGIDAGESIEAAMLRELEEEIGTNDVDVLGSLPDPVRYEWPEALYVRGFRGQEQYYFLVRLREGAVLNLDREPKEFARTEWIGAAEFLSRVSGFKADAYRTALAALQKQFHGLISP